MRSTSRTISSAASSVFASLLREARISAAPADSAQGVLHLVGHARRDAPEGGERLALRDHLLEVVLDRAVAQEDHRAVHLAARVEERRGSHVDRQVRIEAPLDSALVLDRRAAAGEDRAGQPRQRVIRTEQGLHGASAHRLGRVLEDPTRGGVGEIDVSLGVEHDDPRQHGIEHTSEIACHGYAARRSRPKYSRVRPRMTSRSWASSACRRNAALPGRPFE